MSDIKMWVYIIVLFAWAYYIGYKAGKQRGWNEAHKQFLDEALKKAKKEPPHSAD